MTLEEIHEYYGSAVEACRALGISQPNFSVWNRRGYVPLLQQMRIEKLTGGVLCANEEHAYKKERSAGIYLPSYRFFSTKYGMCPVSCITFNLGKKPRISYIAKIDKNQYGMTEYKKIVSFDRKYLMQAVDVLDINGNYVYEGDVIRAKKRSNPFVFRNIAMLPQLKELQGIRVVSHIYQGVKLED